jgi:murein DD-endopeptidase MepM/ murein hydrolase activator NlpD
MAEFKRLRKKLRRRRIEMLLLIGYAAAITCALFVSLLNKQAPLEEKQIVAAEEDYDFSSDFMTPAFNDAVKNNPFDELFADINNINLLSNSDIINDKLYASDTNQDNVLLPPPAKPKYVKELEGIYQKERRVVMINKGDNFIGILSNLGMDYQSATNAYNTLKKVFDARKLQVGQHFEIVATYDVHTRDLESLDYLMIEPVRGTRYILERNEYDQFEAKVEQEEFAYEIKNINGTVGGGVINSLNSAGLPFKLANKIPPLFSHVINFSRDVKKGDSFEVKYEVHKDSNDEIVKIGDILYAKFHVGNRDFKLYRYKGRDGNVAYYDQNGGAKKKGLDKKPLAMRNARVSSLFGYRRHPVYKDRRFHGGVDYAAPSGTAIYASGAGTIEMARYVNGYGNYIKIRHNSEYETAYGHMSRFASGMRPGVRVKQGQIIGYVGSTGRSTGPHLHFEILRKGQRIDPLKAKVATGNDLTGSQLAEFKRIVKNIDNSAKAEVEQKDVDLKVAVEKDNFVQENSYTGIDAKKILLPVKKKPLTKQSAQNNNNIPAGKKIINPVKRKPQYRRR